MQSSIVAVPDEIEEVYTPTVEISTVADNFVDPDEIQKVVTADPFSKIDVTKGSPTVKKAYNKLRKKYEGVDGAESKFLDPEQVYGYSLYNVVEPPYDLEVLGSLYDSSGILRSVIDARVMNTVGLGYLWEPTLKAKQQIQKASSKDDSKQETVRSAHQKEEEMLVELLDTLNKEESFIETLMRIWLDVLTLGNGYMEIGRTLNGKIGYIGHVPAMLVRVRRPRDGFVQKYNQKAVFFRNFGDDTPDPINSDPKPNEMLHFKMYSPNNNFYGVPPSVSVLSALVGDKFAKEYNIDYFENKAIPRYAIILKGVKLSEKSKRELVQYFRNEVKGKNHGTLVVPIPATISSNNDADIRFEKLEADIQDSSFDKYRKGNRDEIISAYRVPPTKVGVYDNANLAVSRDADKTFKSQVVGPDQVIAEKRINRIVAEFTDLFKIKLDSLDVLDEDLRSRIYDRYARIEVMDPNEIRTAIGLQAREGGGKVLPFPVKAPAYWGGKETWGKDLVPDPKVAEQAAKAKMENGGAPQGNTNSGQPAKSGQDNGTNATSADVSGTASERGQAQESGGVRERV